MPVGLREIHSCQECFQGRTGGVWQGRGKCFGLGTCHFHSSGLLVQLLLSVPNSPHRYKMVVYSNSWPVVFQHVEMRWRSFAGLSQGWPRAALAQGVPLGPLHKQTCLPSLPSSQILYFQMNILREGNCVDCQCSLLGFKNSCFLNFQYYFPFALKKKKGGGGRKGENLFSVRA